MLTTAARIAVQNVEHSIGNGRCCWDGGHGRERSGILGGVASLKTSNAR